MKKPIAIHFNDLHIEDGNEDAVYESIKYMVSYANDKGIKDLICNGDIFDNRSFQRLSCLKVWQKCLDLFQANGMMCYVNPGNHCKSRYDSLDSFNDPFSNHPAVKLYRDIDNVRIGGFDFTFSPFFQDDMLVQRLVDHKGGDVLIGHWEMEGSSHLGKVSEKKTINKKLLKKWKKVYLGHYHNHHEISKDIVHLPSLRQSNFGEDDNKRFTIIYDNLSYEIVNGVFKRFVKISIDVDTASPEQLKELLKQHENSKDTVRFEFTGEESKLKAIDKSQFKGTGIDVKIKHSVKYDFESEKIEIPSIIESYGEDEVKESFKSFCLDKGYDHSIGIELLNEFLNKKNGSK